MGPSLGLRCISIDKMRIVGPYCSNGHAVLHQHFVVGPGPSIHVAIYWEAQKYL